jgi:hypothetical protein
LEMTSGEQSSKSRSSTVWITSSVHELAPLAARDAGGTVLACALLSA